MQFRKFPWDPNNSPLNIAISAITPFSDPYLLYVHRGTSTASSPFPTAPGAGFSGCENLGNFSINHREHRNSMEFNETSWGFSMGYSIYHLIRSYKMIWGSFEGYHQLQLEKKRQLPHQCPTNKYPLNWGYLYSIADFRTHQTDLHVPWSISMHLLHGLWSSIPWPWETLYFPEMDWWWSLWTQFFCFVICWLILNYTPENPCMVINIELAAQKSLTIDKHSCNWTSLDLQFFTSQVCCFFQSTIIYLCQLLLFALK